MKNKILDYIIDESIVEICNKDKDVRRIELYIKLIKNEE